MENYLGRTVAAVHTFNTRSDDFGNYYDAQNWLTDNGYSFGSSCAFCPVAVMRGEYNLPQKWRNMSNAQRRSVHGVITGEFRNGEVKVIMFA